MIRRRRIRIIIIVLHLSLAGHVTCEVAVIKRIISWKNRITNLASIMNVNNERKPIIMIIIVI